MFESVLDIWLQFNERHYRDNIIHGIVMQEYGSIELAPNTNAVVGTYRQWAVTYTVGALGMDDGSTIKIAGNMTSDWGVPQFADPKADDYASVETTGNATVEASYDPKGHVRPWKNTVTINVIDGALDEGDTITLTLGDRSGGSMGHQTQTFPETEFRITALVDAFGTGEFVKLPEDLTFDVVPGEPETLVAVVPSTVEPAEELIVSVRVEDFWGNTATSYNGTLQVTHEETEVNETIHSDSGIAKKTVQIDDPGEYRLTVRDEDEGLSTNTNPIIVGDHAEDVFWGDIHGQSGETVGTGTIGDYFQYARDNAFLDFASHAGNDFQISEEFWDQIQSTVAEFHDPNEFVTFLCYEWSANTPRGGDHNVYFRNGSGKIHRSSSWQINSEMEKHRGTHPVSQLYDHYKGRDDVLIIPHQGGRPATLDCFDSDLSPFVEIVSVWGVFEWFGREALDRGYPVGFVGGSDDHTGRPGATYPTNQTDFNIKGGLMAARSDDLSRESLWEAFKERRCYATTGARIILDINIEDADMGESINIDGVPQISVDVRGTAPLSKIDLFRGGDRIETREFDSGTDAVEFRWSGARSQTRHKVQDWSGGVSIDQGRINDVEEFGFDHPEQGVTHRTDTAVRWDGSTSGNYQGVRITVENPKPASISFSAPPIDTTFSLDNLEEEMRFDVGHLDQQLEIRHVGKATQRSANFTFTDDGVDAGLYPYYVRITQRDGEMAWSSPIFVDVT